MTKYYNAGGRRIAMRRGGTPYHLTEDHLGGTALVTNASGAMRNRVRYHPFGSVRTQEFAGEPPALLTDKLFTGHQRETANGLYHYQARLYNTDVGRFPQADTMASGARGDEALRLRLQQPCESAPRVAGAPRVVGGFGLRA